MTEDEIRAQVRERIGAILGAPEAESAKHLAEHFAYETDIPAEVAIGSMRAFHVDRLNMINRGSRGNRAEGVLSDSEFEEKMRAAGALGLAPLVSSAEATQRGWDTATARAHMLHGIEDPEIGASGRTLQ